MMIVTSTEYFRIHSQNISMFLFLQKYFTGGVDTGKVFVSCLLLLMLARLSRLSVTDKLTIREMLLCCTLYSGVQCTVCDRWCV